MVELAQFGINEFFNDPLLMSLIDQALAGNRELRSWMKRSRSPSNEVPARQGAFLPFLGCRRAGLSKPSKDTPRVPF